MRRYMAVDIKFLEATDTAASTGLTISPTRNNYDLVDPAMTFKEINILAVDNDVLDGGGVTLLHFSA
jgi:hypothetical protein